MKIEPLKPFKEVLILSPNVFRDERGFFIESYNKDLLKKNDFKHNFIQDNHSRSDKGVLRGIHYQCDPFSQGKLVRVNSLTFGKWGGIILDDKNHKQLYVPEGFGHAFLVLEDKTDFTYKVTQKYSKESERSILWNDNFLNIKWPLKEHNIKKLVISEKDKNALTFEDGKKFVK